MPSLSPTRVSVMLQRSNKRYQSALLRATRETSRPNTMPTWPSATSAVIRANPERSANPEPDKPRSSSMTITCSLAQPSSWCFLTQSILAHRGLAVVFDLGRGGLANVDEGGALDMVGLHLGQVIHDFPPDCGCLRTMSLARISIARALGSFSSVSHT